jgi:ABC-type phosphate/phosphonate transport system substrate-binding protein
MCEKAFQLIRFLIPARIFCLFIPACRDQRQNGPEPSDLNAEKEFYNSTYRGLIFTRKDSGITTARDMKGKTFAFADKATTTGWLSPPRYFKANGIADPSSWLGEIFYTGTHEDAILDAANNNADIVKNY